METRTIYLHIGAPKTGTSAIQEFLLLNKDALLKKGVHYCDTGMTSESGQAMLAWNLLGIHFGTPVDDRIWDEFLEEIENYKENILISSEFFWVFSKNEVMRVHELLKKYTIKVILYLRRQDLWAMANALQEVKVFNQEFDSIDEIVNKILDETDYNEKVKIWSDIVGDNNIILRPYEKKQMHKNDIYHDFLFNGLGMELTDEYSIPRKGINPRLVQDALGYKFIVNNLPINKEYKNIITNSLFSYSNSIDPKSQQPFQEHTLLSPEKRIEIINTFESKNSELAKKYLNSESLFKEEMPSLNEWKPYKGLSIDAAIEISRCILKDKYKIYSEDSIENILLNSLIHGVINNVINEPVQKNTVQSNSDKLKLMFDNADTIYQYPFDQVQYKVQNDIERLILKEDGLHLDVIGSDPKLYMEYFKGAELSKKHLIINISITAPADTELELFYGTIDSKLEYPFNAKQKVKYPLSTGENDIYVEVSDMSVINKLRLDPGNVPGKYVLHKFEVRADALINSNSEK